MKLLLGCIFLGSLGLISIDAGFYLLGMKTNGVLFALGMALMFIVASISALLERKMPAASELITMLVAASFFAWLAYRSIAK